MTVIEGFATLRSLIEALSGTSSVSLMGGADRLAISVGNAMIGSAIEENIIPGHRLNGSDPNSGTKAASVSQSLDEFVSNSAVWHNDKGEPEFLIAIARTWGSASGPLHSNPDVWPGRWIGYVRPR